MFNVPDDYDSPNVCLVDPAHFTPAQEDVLMARFPYQHHLLFFFGVFSVFSPPFSLPGVVI